MKDEGDIKARKEKTTRVRGRDKEERVSKSSYPALNVRYSANSLKFDHQPKLLTDLEKAFRIIYELGIAPVVSMQR